jgi:propionyl-CoA carboxylase alpha chain
VGAVMDHPRFISGNITTAFIAEEYPEGFQGATLDDATIARVAAAAAAMNRVAEIRRTKVSGTMDNHERRVGDDWVVTLQGAEHTVKMVADHDGSSVHFAQGLVVRVASDWTPGQPLAKLVVDGSPLVMKVAKISGGFRLRLRGADLKCHVRTPRQAELAKLMLEKTPPDTSKFLLCPMPGLVTNVMVAAGDEVQEGQALATVEAMKMENILKAERKGVVKAVRASAGASLKVDEVILEFE